MIQLGIGAALIFFGIYLLRRIAKKPKEIEEDLKETIDDKLSGYSDWNDLAFNLVFPFLPILVGAGLVYHYFRGE